MENKKLSLIVCLSIIVFLIGCKNSNKDKKFKPNFIIIFTDDQGYGDLSSFGAEHVDTPNIDRLAREGAKLTSFYAAAAICTPSRAGLLTGSYPKRVSLATGSVLLAGDNRGLNPDEITIAEILKKQDYSTGIYGKWHLGDQPIFLPTRQGFDDFFGIPYSHDIHPYHPNQGEFFNFPPLPLLNGEDVIEMDPDADYLTKRITERAVQFIEDHREEPFFLYIPHPMPHHPIHVSPEFMKKVPDSVQTQIALENDSINYSIRGSLYPQAISEIDWSVGEIIRALVKHGLDKSTFVLFTSDNGPDRGWDAEPFGSPGPLRGRKGSIFEGGVRVPAVAWWPGEIPAGSKIDEILTVMDLLPTFADLSGTEVPQDREIDGKNIWPVLSGQTKISPHDRFYYYKDEKLAAVRSGPWKYHHDISDGDNPKDQNPALYNLENDIGETKDLSAQYPEIAKKLKSYIINFELEKGGGDSLCTQCRPIGWVDNPKALIKED